MGRGTFSGLSATGFVFKVKTIEVARLCEMKRKKICQTSTRLMEVAGMKGNLSQETERLTPKGKAQNSFSHPKKTVAQGMGLGEDKEDGTFSARKCHGQRGEIIRMDCGFRGTVTTMRNNVVLHLVLVFFNGDPKGMGGRVACTSLHTANEKEKC